MYIILEGMPGTGKTTLAKVLQKKLNAQYIKSVISDTILGDSLKKIRSLEKDKFELLLLADLTLDELRVKRKLELGNVVRDKTLAATLGHLKVHGYENQNKEIVESLINGYQQLKELIIQPDIAIYLEIDKEKIFKYIKNKSDITDADKYLLNNFELYQKQGNAVKEYMNEIYKENFITLNCFSGTVNEMVDSILKMVNNYEKNK